MSIHGATQMKCAICDLVVPLEVARRDWWLCTTCSGYVCPRCYTLFHESGQEICPGSIVRGTDPHPPHFTRFLAPRPQPQTVTTEQRSTVVILHDVPRRRDSSQRGRVIILGDVEHGEQDGDSSIEGEAEDDV